MLATGIFTFIFILGCSGYVCALKFVPDHVWFNTTKEVVYPPSIPQPILFCYEPRRPTKTLFKTWTSVKFFVSDNKDFIIYSGDNESHIHTQYEQTSKSWFQLFPYWTQRVVFLSPFSRSCVGVVSSSKLVANLVVQAFDWYMFSCFLVGAFLFLLAPRLSRNFLFHYGSGVMFGVLASVLVLVFVIGRFIPKKSFFYTILVAGLSLSAYLWNYLYENLLQLLEKYHWYFLGYVVFSGLVSFGVCYYKGPIVNPRLLTIIQWSIQILAILLIYLSSQVKEVVAIFVLLLVLLRQLKLRMRCQRLAGYWYRIFPPKASPLTEEEYYRQGVIETERALEELRKFCRSPKCDAWKTVSRLQSPSRFSKWVDGHSDHLTPDEINEHEHSFEEYYSYCDSEEEDCEVKD